LKVRSIFTAPLALSLALKNSQVSAPILPFRLTLRSWPATVSHVFHLRLTAVNFFVAFSLARTGDWQPLLIVAVAVLPEPSMTMASGSGDGSPGSNAAPSTRKRAGVEQGSILAKAVALGTASFRMTAATASRRGVRM